MSFLDLLTINQKDVVVSLPYRVGLWISRSDETGGSEADAQELQVLSNIIHGFAEEVFGSETVQHIMSEAVNREAEWGEWSKSVSSVLAECADAVDILEEFTDYKDVTAFQTMMMEIGEAVALAFSEYEHAGMVDRIWLKVSFFVKNLGARMRKQPVKSLEEFLSISRRERKALDELAAALGTTYQ